MPTANRRTTGTQQGTSVIEYGLLVTGIAVVVVAVVFLLGGSLTEPFRDRATCSASQSIACGPTPAPEPGAGSPSTAP